MSSPGFQNPRYKPHHDLGTKSKTDLQYQVLKDKIISYLASEACLKMPAVLTADLRALDSEFATGDADRDRLFNQLTASSCPTVSRGSSPRRLCMTPPIPLWQLAT